MIKYVFGFINHEGGKRGKVFLFFKIRLRDFQGGVYLWSKGNQGFYILMS